MSMLRNFMSHKVRSNAGCWTCRLRRKKCDERRPVCESCGALEISCHFDDDKPDWMDGGPKQKEMADRIKMQVKKQASQRRDRRYMDILSSSTRKVDLGADEEGSHGVNGHDDAGAAGAAANGNGNGRWMGSDSEHPSTGPDKNLTPPSSQTSGNSPPEIPWTSQIFDRQGAQEDGGPDVDVHFIMIYLDYVFPYLFPHYRPPIMSGGRGWVLDTLQSNRTVYHTAISLASYFFGVIMANGDANHTECVVRMGDRLQEQVEKGLRELQKDMCVINARRATFTVHDGLSVMQSIIQMVVFELATTNKETWKVHLDAAFVMFSKVLPDPEQWTETLHGLYTPRWPPPSMGLRRPWSTDQAALRFFTANLVHMDVMSSITMERPPRLRKYHDTIIPGVFSKDCRVNAQTAGPIFMDEFIGLHNWTVQMIGDVATLDAWKKEQKAKGTLTQADLVSRAHVLQNAITGSLPNLESQVRGIDMPSVLASIVEDPFPELQTIVTSDLQGFHPAMAFQNALWLRATLVYLYTVVLGWQPEHPDIKEHVSYITKTISSLPRGSCLRGMVWPFFVAGCLSPREDEEKYRASVSKLGALQVFGTIKEACDIMEKVWACRDHVDESWDIAKCLRILGHRSLLI